MVLRVVSSKRYFSKFLSNDLQILNLCRLRIGNKVLKLYVSTSTENSSKKRKSASKNINDVTKSGATLEGKKMGSESNKEDKHDRNSKVTEMDEETANKIRQFRNRNREEKFIFGKLLKTAKQKNQGANWTRIMTVSESADTNNEEELSWIKKLPKPYLRRLSFPPKSELTDSTEKESTQIEVTEKKKQDISTETSNFSDATDQLKSKNNEDSMGIKKEESTSNESPMKITNPFKSFMKIISLPDIIIKHIKSFPIFNTGTVPSIPQNTMQGAPYPSVTGVLRDTMSEESKLALERWKENMISKLGKEGFQLYSQELLRNGQSFHSCIADILLHKTPAIPEGISSAITSVEAILTDITDIVTIEQNVIHPKLQYKGIIDCIASYRGERCVIDWKKSDKKKLNLKSTFDAPIQVAAYIGAINACAKEVDAIKKGLIVVAYTDGTPGTVHEVEAEDLQKYWNIWLAKLQEYYVNVLPDKQKMYNNAGD